MKVVQSLRRRIGLLRIQAQTVRLSNGFPIATAHPAISIHQTKWTGALRLSADLAYANPGRA